MNKQLESWPLLHLGWQKRALGSLVQNRGRGYFWEGVRVLVQGSALLSRLQPGKGMSQSLFSSGLRMERRRKAAPCGFVLSTKTNSGGNFNPVV